MSFRTHFRRVTRNTFRRFGYAIHASSNYGIDWLFDIQRLSLCWEADVRTIFDVGANDGSMSRDMRYLFPSASIFAFEPDPQTYNDLIRNSLHLKNFHPYNCALSSREGTADLFLYPDSRLNSLEANAPYTSLGNSRPEKISIETTTVDIFCNKHGIEEIGLLKVDTEGHDLEVLKGASRLLSARRIRFVITEFNYLQTNSRNSIGALVPIDEFLHQFGFRYLASYVEFFVAEGLLTVSNALFALPRNVAGQK
jgi:FkbM family methyltransferase